MAGLSYHYYWEYTEIRNFSNFQKVTKHCTKLISDSLSWGTEEMPHGDAHPPPVHGINFKQDARLKYK